MTPQTRVSYDREFEALNIGGAISTALGDYRSRYDEEVQSVRADEEDGTVQVTVRGSNTE